MKSWRIIVVLVTVLLGSGTFPALAIRASEQESFLDDEGIEVWSDSRESEAPLQGPDIVRRDASDVPRLRETWIVVVDGVKHESGACGFALCIAQFADTATPKVYLMTAVNPKTCEVEFTVGIPENLKAVPAPDLEYDFGDPEPGDDEDQRVGTVASDAFGYMGPGAADRLLDDPSYYPLPQIRYTVVAEWKDPANKVVNRVLSAVKARVDDDNRQSNARCKNQRAMLVTTVSHWQDMSTGSWGLEDCNKGNFNTRALTSARFKNEDFPLCATLNDPAWVYYDRLLARASTSTNRGFFQFNIVSTWQEGCGEILGWAGIRDYPNEFNNIDDV